MKKKRARFVGTVLALTFACMACPATGFADSADSPSVYSNNGDTGYHFEMKNIGNTSATGFRRKDDTSPVYVKVSSCRNAPRMFVDGARDNNGSGWRDCTSGTYYARKEGKFVMHSLVYENGLRSARITAKAVMGSNALVSGEWSPDSLYSWPTMGS